MSRRAGPLSFVATLLGLCALVGSQAGCRRAMPPAPATPLDVAHAAAAPMACPAEQLTTHPLSDREWQVVGCGRSATFACRSESYRRYSHRRGGCRLLSPPVSVGGAVTAQPSYAPARPPAAVAPVAPAGQDWSDERAWALFAQLQAPVLACVPGSDSLVLTLEIRADGTIARAAGLRTLNPSRRTCVSAALRQARVPGGLSQSVRVPFTFR